MAQITEQFCRDILAAKGETPLTANEKEQLALAWLGREQMPEAVSAEHLQLFKFYGVNTLAALADAQEHHIEKLQAKLPSSPSLAPQRVREG
jgi:hypothetical protein